MSTENCDGACHEVCVLNNGTLPSVCFDEFVAEDPSLFKRNWYSLASGTTMYTIWAGYVALFVVGSFAFYRSRDVQPIRSRSPLFTLTSALGGFMIVTNFAMANYVTGIQLWPCAFSNWTIWLAFPLFLLPFPIRSAHLYIVYKQNLLKVTNHIANMEEVKNRMTIVERRFTQTMPGSSSAASNSPAAIAARATAAHEAKRNASKKAQLGMRSSALEDDEFVEGAEDGDFEAQAPPGASSSIAPIEAPKSPSASSTQQRRQSKRFGLPALLHLRGPSTLTQTPSAGQLLGAPSVDQVQRQIGIAAFSERTIMIAFAVLLLICIVIGLVRQLVASLGYMPPCVGCLVSESQSIVQTVVVLVILLVQIFSSVMIRYYNILDQYWIGVELEIMSFIWTVLLVPACVLSFYGLQCATVREQNNESCDSFKSFTAQCYATFASQHWIIVVCAILTFLLTIMAPLFVAHEHGRRLLSTRPKDDRNKNRKLTALRSLPVCLANPETSKVFQEFCVGAFCVQNVLFWNDVQAYRTLTNVHELRVQCLNIYNQYMSATGGLFLELPAKMQDDYDNLLASFAAQADEDPDSFDYNFEPDPRVFDEAQKEIQRQMETDTFPRFLRSEAASKIAKSIFAEPRAPGM